VSALAVVGIASGDQLRELINSGRLRAAVTRFAGSIGLNPDETSHLVLCVLAVGLTNRDILLEEYPELIEDVSLRAIFGA